MYTKDFWLFLGIIILVLGILISTARAETPMLAKYEYNLYKLVDKLADPYDFNDTIKTLIYIESKNGLYPINLQDPACGITHININTYIKRHKLKDTPFNRNKSCSDLIASPEWAILNAIEELTFWKNIHCKSDSCSPAQYKNIIKSYNAGWNYRGSKAQKYWDKFRKAYNRLKKQGVFNN